MNTSTENPTVADNEGPAAQPTTPSQVLALKIAEILHAVDPSVPTPADKIVLLADSLFAIMDIVIPEMVQKAVAAYYDTQKKSEG